MIGKRMLATAGVSAWDTPLWGGCDNGSGGVPARAGAYLYGMVRLLRPRRVLEVGTSYGFSALHIATALKENEFGMLYTVEIDKERQGAARQNLAVEGVISWVTFEDAITPRPYDLVFLDAGHEQHHVLSYMTALDSHTPEHLIIHDSGYNGNALAVALEYGYDLTQFDDGSRHGIAYLHKFMPALKESQ